MRFITKNAPRTTMETKYMNCQVQPWESWIWNQILPSMFWNFRASIIHRRIKSSYFDNNQNITSTSKSSHKLPKENFVNYRFYKRFLATKIPLWHIHARVLLLLANHPDMALGLTWPALILHESSLILKYPPLERSGLDLDARDIFVVQHPTHM